MEVEDQYGCPLLIYLLIIVNYSPTDTCNSHLLSVLCGTGTVGPVSGASAHQWFSIGIFNEELMMKSMVARRSLLKVANFSKIGYICEAVRSHCYQHS